MAAAVSELALAKVNLALHVLGRRPDGYHELDSVVAFADVGDELTFEFASEFGITASGPFADDLPLPDENIIHAAWRGMDQVGAKLGRPIPIVRIHLRKNLPVASGLGGGSADAAAAIRALARLAGLDWGHPLIAGMAMKLGGDVPICLRQVASQMQGAGGRVRPLTNFNPCQAVLVNPRIGIQTAAVFQKLGLSRGAGHRSPIDDLTTSVSWRNDLLPPAAELAPAIIGVLTALRGQMDLRFAGMSGSGATCFGIFESPDAAEVAAAAIRVAHGDWWVARSVLR